MNRPICSRILIVASVSIVLAVAPCAALAQRGGFGGFHGGGFHGGSGGFHGGGSGFHSGGFGGFHAGGFHGGPGSFGGFHNGFGRFGGGFGGFHHRPFYGGFGGYPWFGWGLSFEFGFWPYWGYPYWYGYGPGWGPYAYAYPYDPYDAYDPYNSDDPRDYHDRDRRDSCDYRYPDTCKSKGNNAPVKPSNMNVRQEPSEPDSLNPDDVSPIVDDSHPAISFIAYRSAARSEDGNGRSASSEGRDERAALSPDNREDRSRAASAFQDDEVMETSQYGNRDSPVLSAHWKSPKSSEDRVTLRPAVRNAIRLLRAMPPDARQQRLHSGRYDSFSPEERRALIAGVQ